MSCCKLRECVVIFSLIDLVIGIFITAMLAVAIVAGLKVDATYNAVKGTQDGTSPKDTSGVVDETEQVFVLTTELIVLLVVSGFFSLANIVLALYLFYGAQKEKAGHLTIWLVVAVCLTIANVIWAVYDFVVDAAPDALAFGISVGDGVYTTVEVLVVAWYIQTLKQNRVVETLEHQKA